MTTRQTIIKTKESDESDENSPGIVAYRVGKLEIAVAHGLELVNEKLDTLANNFATKSELREVRKDLDDVSKSIRELEKSVSDLTIIRKLVYGFSGLILIAVVTALIALVVMNGGK